MMNIAYLIFTFLCISGMQSVLEQAYIETCLTMHPADDRYASFSPDGTKILFESNRDGDWNIYMMEPDGSNQVRLTDHQGDDRRPAWHPSGMKIIYESTRADVTQLLELKIASHQEKLIFTINADKPLFAKYAPNGRYISASLVESDHKSNIVILNKRGKIIRQITDNAFRNYFASWSPDGSEVVYHSRQETDNLDDEIYRHNLKTNGVTRLTHWPTHNFCPSWSKENVIAYATSMPDSRPEIYLMESDGTNQRRITNNQEGDTLPSWDPVGERLLITAYRGDNYEICLLTPEK